MIEEAYIRLYNLSGIQMDIWAAYNILGLPSGSSQEEVKAAYRKLVKQWHPDQYSHDPALKSDAELALKRINVAFECLKQCNFQYVESPHHQHEDFDKSDSGHDKTQKKDIYRGGHQVIVFIMATLSVAIILVVLHEMTGLSMLGKGSRNTSSAEGIELAIGESLYDANESSLRNNEIDHQEVFATGSLVSAEEAVSKDEVYLVFTGSHETREAARNALVTLSELKVTPYRVWSLLVTEYPHVRLRK